MEKKTEQQIEELIQERLERYYQQLEELGHKELADELRNLPDREPEPIPDEVFEDPAVQEYISNPPGSYKTPIKKHYNTENQVKKNNKLAEMPEKLAVITQANYRHSLTPVQQGNAYLQPLIKETADNLEYKDGKLYFKGVQFSEARLSSLYSNEVPDIDLPFLQLMYSLILKNYDTTISEDNTINQTITVYMPNLMRALGHPGAKEAQFDMFKAKIMSYQTIMGYIEHIGLQPVLLYAGEDKRKNIIHFTSPYLETLVKELYKVSIRRTKTGDPKLKKNGEPLTLPTNAYNVSPEILKEKSKYAIINVFTIIALIKESGDGVPHISAKTMIDRNLQFKEALEASTPQHRNTQLKRLFSNTWRMLRQYTTLKEDYPDIELPDPNDPASIPTWKTLKTTVFSFPKYKNEPQS